MCQCGYKAKTAFSTSKQIKIIYTGQTKILVGLQSHITYGLRKPGQTTYILEEDFDFITMERVENATS